MGEGGGWGDLGGQKGENNNDSYEATLTKVHCMKGASQAGRFILSCFLAFIFSIVYNVQCTSATFAGGPYSL